MGVIVVSRSEGPNFDIEERADGIAIVRVWRRPELSRAEGARCAELIAGHMSRLAIHARACIFDLTWATTTWGPATHQAIGQMLAAWERLGKPIYIVQAPEALQQLLLRELRRDAAPCWGALVDSRAAALQALGVAGEPPPSASSTSGRRAGR